MMLETEQHFSLPHPGGRAAALAFVRSPAVALAQVQFLSDLQASDAGISGQLVIPVPVLGKVDLPFASELILTPSGADLCPQPLANERAWIAVAGQAAVAAEAEQNSQAATMTFGFQFVAHLQLPEAEGWGGAAFEKMVRAAASRTLERVAAALPAGLAQAAAKGSGRY